MKSLVLWVSIAIFWSGSYTAVKVALDSYGPLTLVAARMLIAAAILYLVLILRSGSLPLAPRALVAYAVPALFGNMLPFMLIGYGETHVDSGLAALLMGIAPVVTVFAAAVLFADEGLTLKKIAGCGVGIAGLVVLVGSTALSGLGDNLLGQSALLGAALCYAGTTLYVRRFIRMPPLQMATGSILLGALPSAAAALVFEAPFQQDYAWNAATISLIYLGLFSTAAATLIYFHLVPLLGATRMQQINFLVPVLGTLSGMAFLGEMLRVEAFAALAFILLAIALVTDVRLPRFSQATLKTGPKLPSAGATPGPST